MDQSLRGVDSSYDRLVRSPLRGWLARNVSLPLYFHGFNEGWILEVDGTIAGWLYLQHLTQSTHINDIGVAPEYQRQGNGTRLLTWAETRATEKGKGVLTLAVTASNHPAVSLYTRSGFRPLHHALWQGTREMLPVAPSSIRPRELDAAQRPVPFREFWSHALAADGQPTTPLLADQLSHWYTGRGQAWELWRERRLVGYADLVANVLRLFLGTVEGDAPLQAAWSALTPLLPSGSLRLDLGSNVADEQTRPLLERAGWKQRHRKRMLMVKSVKETH